MAPSFTLKPNGINVVRIRYRKRTNEGFLSSQPLIASNELVEAQLEEKYLRYRVVSRETGKTLDSGESASRQMLRKNVKSVLKSMGVLFGDEVRKRAKVVTFDE